MPEEIDAELFQALQNIDAVTVAANPNIDTGNGNLEFNIPHDWPLHGGFMPEEGPTVTTTAGDFYYQRIYSKPFVDKAVVYIEDDVTKKDTMSKDIVLTREEIIKGTVKVPTESLFKDLQQDANTLKGTSIFAVGRIYQAKIYHTSKGTGKFSPFLVMGYVVNNKVIKDNASIAREYILSTKSKKNWSFRYIMLNLETQKLLGVDGYFFNSYATGLEQNVQLKAISNFKYRIKDSALSAKVFGNAKIKDTLVDKIFTPVEFSYGTSLKLNSETYYVLVTDEVSKKAVKFCIEDIEILLPSLKGYNVPKDKTIKIGNIVVLKDNPDKPYKVVKIYTNDSSKRLCKNSDNNQLDVLQLIPINGGDALKIYAKNIKL